ncbi:MAG: restriction endonuclease [Candidatus Bathyarchaeia archaeon]
MADLGLLFLAKRYFESQGYSVEQGVTIDSISGIPYSFDLQAWKRDEVYLVYVKDWKRTVGVNMVMKIDKAVEEVGFGKAVLVANKFSDHAKSFSMRRGIRLLTPRELKLKIDSGR